MNVGRKERLSKTNVRVGWWIQIQMMPATRRQCTAILQLRCVQIAIAVEIGLVQELQEMCSERQLGKHGRKAELVARLQDDDEANEVRFIDDDDEEDDEEAKGGVRERAPAGSPQVK